MGTQEIGESRAKGKESLEEALPVMEQVCQDMVDGNELIRKGQNALAEAAGFLQAAADRFRDGVTHSFASNDHLRIAQRTLRGAVPDEMDQNMATLKRGHGGAYDFFVKQSAALPSVARNASTLSDNLLRAIPPFEANEDVLTGHVEVAKAIIQQIDNLQL